MGRGTKLGISPLNKLAELKQRLFESLPLKQDQRFYIMFRGNMLELDVKWMTSRSWEKQDLGPEWTPWPVGDFVFAFRLTG